MTDTNRYGFEGLGLGDNIKPRRRILIDDWHWTVVTSVRVCCVCDSKDRLPLPTGTLRRSCSQRTQLWRVSPQDSQVCCFFRQNFGTRKGLKNNNSLSSCSPVRKLTMRWGCNLYRACSCSRPRRRTKSAYVSGNDSWWGTSTTKDRVHFQICLTGGFELRYFVESWGNLPPIRC